MKNLLYILLLIFYQTTFSQVIIQEVEKSVHDSTFVNLKEYSSAFVYDMRYATENNFLKAKVYDCAECYLRFKTIKKLVEANQKFMKLGYKIKIFDCYRPLDVQKKMWAIVSNPSYVADPSKGSIHNRGAAVDITLVDLDGNELDMGTDFDHFGKESAHLYQDLSETVLNNRKLLREVMEDSSFKIIKSEWWHYDLVTEEKDKVSNFTWNCD
ncbi:MAG TPA: M15 family metallopeptidase [Flavobacterium sp.]|uniref:M15 family metallopeptidase n=1 Tax=unclassified Flavobacterium TaxID=196869 RepID=UPI0025C136AA|nr:MULTISPECIES: M15 family metallopeptidase [unclassified Flavobacterium]HRE78068.1 M15 family metallopeptidase [Flavobacterium sp.]